MHTKSQYFPQYVRRLGSPNRLEATSHKKLTTNGAFPELILTHTESLLHSHQRDRPTHTSWANSPPEQVARGGGEWKERGGGGGWQ